MNERIFCEIDIGNRENAVSNLETYLLRSNVTSDRAKQNAQKALKEKEETSTSEIGPSVLDGNPVDDVTTDNPSEKRPVTFLPESDVEWTIDMVRKSLSQELRTYYDKTYSEERRELFYGAVAGIQNLVKEKGWKLNQPKFSKMLCGFWLTDKGVIGNVKRIFGILPQGSFPVSEIVGRDGKLIPRSPIIPRFFVRITREEARQLEREHDGCEFCAIKEGQKVDTVYYNIPENMSILFRVLEFAYKKHTGTNLSDNT